MNGSRSSQLSCSHDTNMANIASRVLLKRSTNPSLRGWYGVVFVFTVPSNSESLCTMVLSNSFPWSECRNSGNPYVGNHLSINASASERAVLSAKG